jgi:23S rRNA (adenine2503-C2)-methyltransferase
LTLPRLRDALVGYAEKTGRRPSLEYALIAGINDDATELEALEGFCRGMLVHVNLITVNSVAESSFTRSPTHRLVAFEHGLSHAGIEVSVRAERGSDIDAACGQLRQRAPRLSFSPAADP